MSSSHLSSLPPKPASPRPDVLVIGGGLIGLACADALAQRGARVELWEQQTDPQSANSVGAASNSVGAASAASAGMLAPLAEVSDDREFLAICLQARDLWRVMAAELEARTGVDLDYDDTGALVLEQPHRPIARIEATARAAGERAFRIDAAEARALIPDLGAAAGPFLYLAGDHRIDNRLVYKALVASLEARGVTMRFGRRVEKITSRPGGMTAISGLEHLDAGAVLITAGAWSGQLTGIPPLPIHPVKGQMMRFDGVDWPLSGCLRGGHFYAARRRGGGLLLGATVEPEAGFDTAVTGAGLESLLSFARRALPGLLARPLTDSWAGLRPGSCDGRPLIGQLEPGLWLASGHYRNGVLLTPWTAHFLATWLDTGDCPDGGAAELFRPLRKSELATAP